MRSFAAEAPKRRATLDQFAAKDANSYGVIRLAAAIAVVFTHAFGVVGGWDAPEPLFASTGWSLGAHAVHVFFALSGFMVAASWERSSGWIDFVVARALRIMPALICVNIAIVLIGGLWLTTLAPADFWTLDNVGRFMVRATLMFSVGVGLDGVFMDNPMPRSANIPIWTIRYEVICYFTLLAFMSAMAVIRMRGLMRLVAVAPVLVCSGLVISVSGEPEAFGFVAQFARFVFTFYLGVACWIARDHVPMRGTIAAAFGIAVLAVLWAGLPVRYPVMILATAYWSLWLGTIPMGWLQRWTARTDLSYGVYITGFFIQQWLVVAVPGISVAQNALAATALSLMAAWISWTYVEKPALGLRRFHGRLFSRQTFGAPAAGQAR
ncbi:MAG: acyltransferase [Rhizobiaceae bacterium]|nr:acyltransferase [Rhizobiaceae bacterium]